MPIGKIVKVDENEVAYIVLVEVAEYNGTFLPTTCEVVVNKSDFYNNYKTNNINSTILDYITLIVKEYYAKLIAKQDSITNLDLIGKEISW